MSTSTLEAASPPARRALRQKLLVLYLGNSTLESGVVGWSFYDGTGREKYDASGETQPPYPTGLAAMLDGWRVIAYPALQRPYPGREYELAELPFEFVFEKLEEIHVH
jgi:hypothetical protein